MDVRDLAQWLGERLDKLEAKVDAVGDRQGTMGSTLAGQAAQLGEHMRRTDALEKRVEQVAEDVKPVREHVAKLRGAAALVALLATIAGVLRAILG